MAAIPEWDNAEQTIIRTIFDEEYGWEDFYAAVREMHRMVASVPHTVDLILVQHRKLPPGNPLAHFQTAFKQQPPNTGRVIVINAAQSQAVRSFMKALASIMDRLYPQKGSVLFADSLEDARRILADIRDPKR
jgi:hypothetical protein